MAEVDAIGALAAGDWAVVHGESDGVTLTEGHHLDPALHARPLFGQHEFAAGEIAPGFRKQYRDL